MSRWKIIKTILVEGNIATGKSTILSHIDSTFSSNLVQVHREPVENWTNIKGFDLLQALYTDSHRWTFAFEMSALLSRIRHHHQSDQHRLHIYERSIFSTFHVFIRHDLNENYLNQAEHRILEDHFNYGLQQTIDLSTTMILYLKLPAHLCFERLMKRSRPSESTVDLQRLEKLQIQYENFLEHFHLCPVKTIDASQPLENICEQIDDIVKEHLPENRSIQHGIS